MELYEHVDKVQTREDFVLFVHALRSDPKMPDWENIQLPSYLEALAAFTEDTADQSQDFFANSMTQIPSWNLFARLLFAATMYE